jgi:hypothetical protein
MTTERIIAQVKKLTNVQCLIAETSVYNQPILLLQESTKRKG